MRRWLALAGVAALGGCGGSPTAPTPDFVGSYSFVVEASSVCEMPIERFEWSLVATAVAGQQSDDATSFRLTLPGGDPTLSISLAYVQRQGGRGQPQGDPTLTINLNAQNVPLGDSLEVTISGSPRGTATETGGRGQILDGSINGNIRLAEPGPRGSRTAIGSCSAGDHRFILSPL